MVISRILLAVNCSEHTQLYIQPTDFACDATVKTAGLYCWQTTNSVAAGRVCVSC